MAGKKKRRNASPGGSPRKGKPPSAAAPSSPWGYAVFAIVGGLAGLLVTLALLTWQVLVPANSSHQQAIVDQTAQQWQASINGRLADLMAQADAAATSADVVAALTSFDARRISAAGRSLAQSIPYALRVDIIEKGKAAVDLSSDVPVSFAALAAIKRAEGEPYVGPEVALNQRQVFYVARPITHQGTVAGTLYLAMSMDYLLSGITGMDPSAGMLQIKQQFAGEAANVILEHGTSAEDAPSASRALSNQAWSLTVTGGKVEPVVSLMSLLTPAAVGIALLLGGIFLSFSRLFRKMDDDADSLGELVERRLAGRSARMHRFHLPTFSALASHVLGRSSGSAVEPAEPEVSDSASDAQALADDLTDDVLDLDDEPEPAGVPAASAAKPKRGSADDFLDVNDDDNFGIEVTESEGPVGIDLDEDIFRAYDIRGIVTENLTEEVVYWVGRAFAAEALSKKATRVAVGRDGRHSSPLLRDALARGLMEGGADVVDVGEVPTPLLYYANFALDTGTGIMITGSHNPPEYNGLKMVIAGETLAEGRIQDLKRRLLEHDLSEGEGEMEEVELVDHYIDRVLDDVAIAQPLKVVVDCGNGVAGAVAPRLLRELGCEVIELYCDVDGDFPNHHPDPADPKNLDDLITVVAAENADLGLAFDGDGDRVGVITNRGQIVWPDKLMMLFARDIVGRNPGADIIYDVKCSRHLNALISEYGGRPIMWKTGHSHIKAKIKETGALLGGEFSGHICFAERWYGFDDALYSAARLLEILGAESQDADSLFAEFPVTFTTPEIKIYTTESAKFTFMKQLEEQADWGDGTITSIDGIRVDYPDGWGLIRPSNTSPVLTLRFEADGESALDRIKDLFRAQLAAVDPAMAFDD